MISSPALVEEAPAKVNLFLHVGARGDDGYHRIVSLMVFADLADRLGLEVAERMDYALTGHAAAALAEGDNLVTRARDRLLAALDQAAITPFRLSLDKRLPVAAGLGGGSSDAAATLRLIARDVDVNVRDPRIAAVAAALGADVPACLLGRPLIAEGRGERITPLQRFPALPAILVNPGEACGTAAVFSEFDRAGGRETESPPVPDALADAQETARFLRQTRNDLEAPAIRLHPVIGEVLDLLSAQPESLLARMSGSGATVFALCPSRVDATRLAHRLRALRPRWWVRTCVLGGVRESEEAASKG